MQRVPDNLVDLKTPINIEMAKMEIELRIFAFFSSETEVLEFQPTDV